MSNMINFVSIIAGIAVFLAFIFYQFNQRLKRELKDVKRERDDLILGFERMQQNAKKYEVIKRDAFDSDINKLLKRMRERGEVYPK